MINFLPSEDDSTVALEFDGKATKADAEKVDEFVKLKFGENKKFNIFAIMHDVDGSTLKGMAKGIKVDAKHWSQFRKFAVVSDKNWLQAAGDLGNFLPGVKAKHFEKSQKQEAWEWIKE